MLMLLMTFKYLYVFIFHIHILVLTPIGIGTLMLCAFINNLCVNETDLLLIFPFSINKPRGEKT